MNTKACLLVFLWIFSNSVFAEIPDWYKQSIEAQYDRKPFSSIILFKVKTVTFVSENRGIYSYRVDTDKLKSIKGKAPTGDCYFIHTEGEWQSPYLANERSIVILLHPYSDECGVIEPGYGAPGTEEYVKFFESLLKE